MMFDVYNVNTKKDGEIVLSTVVCGLKQAKELFQARFNTILKVRKSDEPVYYTETYCDFGSGIELEIEFVGNEKFFN